MTTTDKYFNDSKDGDVLKNAEPEPFDGPIKLQIVIVIVYGFLCVAILTGSVAIYIYKREKYKNGNNGYFVILFTIIRLLTEKKIRNKIKMLQTCINMKRERKGNIIKKSQVRFCDHCCPTSVCPFVC